MDGIIPVNKPAGITSRELDNRAKRILDSPGVGHLGTLDPFASGLLILGVGQGTKLFPFMEDFDKTYVATLKLGQKRDTGELNGEVIETRDVPSDWKDHVNQVLKSFLGDGEQVPPRYSAKHVDGKRAYELARDRKSFELSPQRIQIKDIWVESMTEDTLVFGATVSRGTYIRTLGEDIAQELGTCGYLTALRRTDVGPFHTEDSKKEKNRIYTAINAENISTGSIISLEDATSFMETVEATGQQVRAVENGAVLFLSGDLPEIVRVLVEGKLRDIYRKAPDGAYRCARGFKG